MFTALVATTAMVAVLGFGHGAQAQDAAPDGATGFEVTCEGTYQIVRWARQPDDTVSPLEEGPQDPAFARLIVDVVRQEVWLVDGVRRGEDMLMSEDAQGWDWLRRRVTFDQVDLARVRSDDPSNFYRIVTLVADGRGGYWFNDTLHEAETETTYQTGDMLARCSRVGWLY